MNKKAITLLFILTILRSIGVNAMNTSNKRTVFIHLFEWPWNDIATECERFLGRNGFSAVQVSPPNEHAIFPDRPWYERYQPVSYNLISSGGNEIEFADMVRRCKNAGVDIYVDAVINHMTWIPAINETREGIGGTIYSRYKYYALYDYEHFHHYDFNGDGSIQNYQNRFEVQNGNVALCADLATEHHYVQKQIKKYFRHLITLGVKGIRIDAAKHISSSDLALILEEFKNQIYVFQEVLDLGIEPIKAIEYLPNGDVTEFKYSKAINDIFSHGKLSYLRDLGIKWDFLPSENAVIFIDNHDTQRHNDQINYKSGNLYYLANAFMLAYPYGYPQILSSYPFQNYHEGPPRNSIGKTVGPALAPDKWNWEHHHPYIYKMVQFRNKTDEKFYVTNWWSNGNNQIAFGRDDLGFIAINRENSPMTEVLQTNMSPGNYSDLLSNTIIFVDNRRIIHATLPPQSAFAILKKN